MTDLTLPTTDTSTDQRKTWLGRLFDRLKPTPEQAETLARIKFPCC